jgi:CBS domain containing-hemolysin-like protein
MQPLGALVLVVLLAACLLLGSASRALPPKELKRRARNQKDSQAAAIYKMVSYGTSLDLLLWLIGSLSVAGLLVMAAKAEAWIVVLLVLVLGWLVWRGRQLGSSAWRWKAAAILAPAATGLLSLFQPILGRIAGWLEQRRFSFYHTNVYEKEDLLELIHSQANQMDNRIPEPELKMALNALNFGDKSVGSVMTPRRVIRMVAASDPIGPLLMDELHASGFSRFPVIKESTKAANPDIIGMLYLHDLVGHTEKGRVRDVMKKKVYFINEVQSLRDALAAFLKTEHHLLVVVNNFEEIVGVISLDDVLEQILGEKIIGEFDRYDDMRSVAGLEAKKDEDKHSQSEVVE